MASVGMLGRHEEGLPAKPTVQLTTEANDNLSFHR
jgi:hypothetical protein